MFPSLRRWSNGGFMLAAVVCLLGCGQQPPLAAPPREEPPVALSQEPSEIELYEPKVVLTRPDLVEFEVKYRFVKGRPDKLYRCDISFPDTENHALRMMQSPELKMEGIIRDKVSLRNPPVKTFEIYTSERTAPMMPHTKNSNVVTGVVQR